MEKLQPKLRFPEFDGDLPVFRFGDLYTFFSTNSLSRDKMNYEEGEVYNIHYGDIHTKFNSRFILENELVPRINLDVDISKIKEELYCQNGDIIIADASEDYADIGKSIEIINTNNQKLLAGLHTFLARPITNKTSIGFINIALKSWSLRKQIMLIAQGTKVLSLSSSRFADLKLNLPTLPEQQKIATFLTTVDDKISNLKQKVSLLEKYKKGVMQQIFSQQLRFKDTSGNDYPDWEEKSLGDIAVRITQKNQENNLNVLTISAQFGLISQLSFFNKSVSAKNLSGYYLLSKNDFAYNKSYSNGYPMGAIKRLNKYDKGVVSTLYICFRFNHFVDFSFMEHYFETGLQNKEIEKIAQEGARNHGLLNISVKDFFSITMIIPSLKEQTKIAEFLSGIDDKIQTTKLQLSKMEVWKKGLLQGMFC
jgi:type I restriction enzyme S subunit